MRQDFPVPTVCARGAGGASGGDPAPSRGRTARGHSAGRPRDGGEGGTQTDRPADRRARDADRARKEVQGRGGGRAGEGSGGEGRPRANRGPWAPAAAQGPAMPPSSVEGNEPLKGSGREGEGDRRRVPGEWQLRKERAGGGRRRGCRVSTAPGGGHWRGGGSPRLLRPAARSPAGPAPRPRHGGTPAAAYLREHYDTPGECAAP